MVTLVENGTHTKTYRTHLAIMLNFSINSKNLENFNKGGVNNE